MAGGVWVAVNASMKGFASTVLKETNSTAKQAGKQFEQEFSTSGKLAGASLAKAVESQTSKLASSRNLQAQATKQLKIAEQELENVQRNVNATAVQVAAAEQKAATARASLEDATRRVTRDEAALVDLRESGTPAVKAVVRAEDAAAKARIDLADATGKAKVAEADFEAKRAASEQAAKELAAAEQRLAQTRQTGDSKAISAGEREVEVARRASDRASKAAATAEGKLGEARVRVQNATDQLSAKQRTHVAVVKDVKVAQEAGAASTTAWGKAIAGMDHPLSAVTGKLTGFAGLVAGGLGLAGGIGFFGDAITQGMELDRVMGSLQAVTGSTGETMRVVGEKARQLGMDESLAGTSAVSATDAMLALAKGGMSVTDAMEAAKGSIQLAGAAQIDAGQAAEIQIAALNSFGLAAGEAGRVADVLTNTANNSATGITELAESLKYAAPVASTLGISLEDTNTMIGLFANNGVKGSEAGTAFRSSLLSLASPSKEAAKALDVLGVKAFDADGKFVGLATVSDQLKAAHERMGDAAFTAAAATAFGREAVGFATTAAKGGSAAFNELRAAMDRQGSASETAGAKLAGMNGAMDRFQNAVDDAKLRVYELVAPALTEWLDSASGAVTGLTDAFGKVIGVMERHPDVMKTIAGAAAGVVAGFAAIKAVQAGMWATSFAKEFVATIRLMPALLTAQATGTGAATAAQHGLNAAMRANPIGFVATLITALIGALIWFFSETETGQKIWGSFMGVLKKGWAWLKDTLAPVWDVITDAWSKAWGWITDTVSDLQKVFTGFYNMLFKGDYDGSWYEVLGIEEDSWIVNYYLTIHKAAKAVFDLFVNGDYTGAWYELFGIEEDSWIIDYFLRVRDSFLALYNLIFKGDYTGHWYTVFGIEEDSWVVAFILSVRDAIVNFSDNAEKALTIAKDAWNGLKDAFSGGEEGSNLLDQLFGKENMDRLREFAQGFGDAIFLIKLAWGELAAFFNNEGGETTGLKALFGDDADEIAAGVQFLGIAFRGLQAIVVAVLPHIGSLIQALGTIGVGVFQSQLTFAITALRLAWLNVQTAVQLGVTLISAVFTQLGITLSTVWETIKNVVFFAFSQAIDNLVTTFTVAGQIMRGDWAGVAQTLQEYYARVKERVFDAFREQLTIFRNYFVSTNENVKSSINSLISIVREIPGRIQSIFADAGKWLYNAGRRIIQGLIDGIRSMFGAVSDAVSAVTSSVTGDVRPSRGGGFAAGGRVPVFARGGRLPTSGPGTHMVDGFVGVSDGGVPVARVNRGEWVINGASSEKYHKELAAINAGTFPKLQGYATGGRVGANELMGLVQGSHSQPLHGSPYVWGGVKWGDCSGTVSAVANFAAGLPPFGSRFATSNESSELQRRGFRRGKGQPGDLRVGFRNGGPGGGHTSGTLPNGVNFEMGGAAPSNGKVGRTAAGAHDSYYTDFFYLPVVDHAAIAAEAAQAAQDSAAVHATALGETFSIPDFDGDIATAQRASTAGVVNEIRQEPAFDPTKAAPMSPENAAKYGFEVANKVFWESIGDGGLEKLVIDQLWDSSGLSNSFIKGAIDKAGQQPSLPSWYGTTHPDNPATRRAEDSAQAVEAQAVGLDPEERAKDPQLKGAVYDTGGWLRPGEVAVNLGNKPEYILNGNDSEKLARGGGITLVVNVDGDEVLRKRVDRVEDSVTINTRELADLKSERRSQLAGVTIL